MLASQTYQCNLAAIVAYLHLTLKANSRFPLSDLSCLFFFFFEMLSFLCNNKITKLPQGGKLLRPI